MISPVMHTEMDTLQRYWRHLERDIVLIRHLIPIRLAHLARQLKQLCETAIIRARNRTLALPQLHAVRRILEEALEVTAHVNSRSIVKLFLEKDAIGRRIIVINHRVRRLSFSVAPGMRIYTSADEHLDAVLDLKHFDGLLSSYSFNPVLLHRLVGSIRPYELRDIMNALRATLSSKDRHRLGPIGLSFASRALRGVETRLSAGLQGTASGNSPFRSPLAGSPMPPLNTVRAQLSPHRHIGTMLHSTFQSSAGPHPVTAALPGLSSRSRAISAGSLPSPAFLHHQRQRSAHLQPLQQHSPFSPPLIPRSRVSSGAGHSNVNPGRGIPYPASVPVHGAHYHDVTLRLGPNGVGGRSPYDDELAYSYERVDFSTDPLLFEPASGHRNDPRAHLPHQQQVDPALLPAHSRHSPHLSPSSPGLRSPSPSQHLPQLISSGINTTVRYYDTTTLTWTAWQPFRQYLWPVPPSVSLVVDWHDAPVQPESAVRVVCRFSALDETLAEGVVAGKCGKSLGPDMLFDAREGDRLRVLQIFNVRGTVWLACLPAHTLSGASGATAVLPQPGFIPLKAVVAHPGAESSRTDNARFPTGRISVPLHGSARSFRGRFRFKTSAGTWNDVPVRGIVLVTQIVYHGLPHVQPSPAAPRGTPSQSAGQRGPPAARQVHWHALPFVRLLDIVAGVDAEVVLTLRENTQDRAIHVLFEDALAASYFLEDALRMKRLSAGRH